jgi:hypothetical protein
MDVLAVEGDVDARSRTVGAHATRATENSTDERTVSEVEQGVCQRVVLAVVVRENDAQIVAGWSRRACVGQADARLGG